MVFTFNWSSFIDFCVHKRRNLCKLFSSKIKSLFDIAFLFRTKIEHYCVLFIQPVVPLVLYPHSLCIPLNLYPRRRLGAILLARATPGVSRSLWTLVYNGREQWERGSPEIVITICRSRSIFRFDTCWWIVTKLVPPRWWIPTFSGFPAKGSLQMPLVGMRLNSRELIENNSNKTKSRIYFEICFLNQTTCFNFRNNTSKCVIKPIKK